MNLNELRDMVHRTAVEHGWWDRSCAKDVLADFPDSIDDPVVVNEVATKLALIHSEVSEALECVRENPFAIVAESTHLLPNPDGTLGKPEGFASELADVVIRVLDLCGALGVDIERELMAKHRYNVTRPHRHGGEGVVSDKINPPHYKSRSVECVDLAEKMSFCAGNALKYIWRAGDKPGVPAHEDWSKAAWYLRRCNARAENYADHAFVSAIARAIEALTDDPVKAGALGTMRDGFAVAAAYCESISLALRSHEMTQPVPSAPEEDCDEPTKGDECVG